MVSSIRLDTIDRTDYGRTSEIRPWRFDARSNGRARGRSLLGTSRASRVAAAWGWLLGVVVTAVVLVAAFGAAGAAILVAATMGTWVRRPMCATPA